jgi:C_GCAxxG_C_C family probable redox protein
MNTKSEVAADIFESGFNCAQAVFAALSADYGLDPVMAKKVAGAFGGGMAYNGEVCGAVSGALMLIGLKYGKCREDDVDAKEKTYRLATEYIRRFKEIYDSVRCGDLIHYDLTKEEELLKAREAGAFKTVCPLLVKKSVELVEAMLA